MTTDTKLQELIINKLTTSQYDSIEEKDPNQIYIVTDALGFDNTITNCLTRVPQDINLELVDGTLTSKTGMKVYVPNGFESDGTTPKFDVVTIESDYGLINSWGTAEEMAVFLKPMEGLAWAGSGRLVSGTTAPTETHTMYWYDTNENLIKRYSGGSFVDSGYSLPIALCTKTSVEDDFKVASINQIFNGFSYIGSTVFALPGVKGLIPNGRNKDGTLKNIEFMVDKVTTNTTNFTNRNNQPMWFDYNEKSFIPRGLTFTVDEYTNTDYNIVYDTKLNKYFYRSTGNYEETIGAVLAFGSINRNSKYTLLTPKTPFRVVDRNDSSWLSGLSVPSDKFIDLTLGASGSTYTAPATGYFFLAKKATAQGQYIDFVHRNSSDDDVYLDSRQAVANNTTLRKKTLVCKGGNVKLNYSVSGATDYFRFIYAEGETE